MMIRPLKERHQFSTLSSSVSHFCPPFQPFPNPSKPLENTLQKMKRNLLESRLDAIASPNFDTILWWWWWCLNPTKLCFMLFVVVCIDSQFSCGFMSGVIGHFCHQWAQISPSRLNVIKIQTTSELTSQRRQKSSNYPESRHFQLCKTSTEWHLEI